MTNLATLINRSQLHTETVTVDYDRALAEELLSASDGHVEPNDGMLDCEYWGEDADGTWRIHMRAEPSERDDSEPDREPADPYSDLTFVVPPECQGQIVEYAYAIDSDREDIVCRTFDASDRTTSYSISPLENLVGEFEPWNHRPLLTDDGLWTTVS